MALDADQVRVAATGRIYVAPVDTAPPADSGTSPAAGWIDMGYVSEDGVSLTFDRTTEDVNAWQGTKLRVITTDEPASVSFTLMETSQDTYPVIYGGGEVTGADDEWLFTPPGKGDNAIRALLIDWNDGAIVYRYHFPRVQVEGSVEQQFSATAAASYPLTLGVLDADPKWTLMTNDPSFAITPPPFGAGKKAAVPA